MLKKCLLNQGAFLFLYRFIHECPHTNLKLFVMKKLFTTFCILIIWTASVHAQIDTTWKKGGGTILNFNQTSLTNWAAGGESNLALSMLTNFYANYKKEKTTWDNTLVMNYGLITANNYADLRKNDDRLELNSKYGQYAFLDHFYYSGLVNFISQFANGFDYITDPEATTPISKALSPGYLTAALGLDWKPNDKFSLFLSPATGKMIFVIDDSISNKLVDTVNNKNLYGNIVGDKMRTEFGAMIIASLVTPIGKTTTYTSKLTLFNNYTDPIPEHRGNIDVDFQNTLAMKLNKFIAATIFLQVLYDHDITIPTFDENDIQIGAGPKTQFKEVFGLGFSYSFAK